MPFSGSPIIDADAHVIETERTWDFLEPSEEKFRPKLYSSPSDPTIEYWVIADRVSGRRFPTLSDQQLRALSNRGNKRVDTPQAARQVDDVKVRVAEMDRLGIDIQVLHNTLWIEQVSRNANVEAALCRSYNKWAADIWRQANGRLHWTCVVPAALLDEAIVQMRFAKEHGSVGVCLRPFDGDKYLIDSYYYPLFEEAESLGLSITVHIANASPAFRDLFSGTVFDNANAFALFRAPTMMVCHSLLHSDIPTLFPKLRWGFIEASASWVPWIYHEIKNRRGSEGREMPNDLFGEANIFVTCQTDDDIPYILNFSGSDSLVIGTDYGHIDPSSEVDAISVFRSDDRVLDHDKRRILSDNPRNLYGL